MMREFRSFVARGNVIDLAVGVVIGAAFTTVVNSFVNDILMPPIGRITGGVDFTELFIDLSGERHPTLAAAREAGAATINYGLFLNNLIAFVIVAFAVFLLVKSYERFRTVEDAGPPTDTEKVCPFCALLVPRAAVRCGHCTSSLEASATA